MMAPAADTDPKCTEGKRILVVEDSYLAAIQIEECLNQLGFQVVGPVSTLDEGKRLAEQQDIQGAILDINIIGGNSSPIAQVLRDRDCPFFFVTGYASPQHLPEDLSSVRRLRKPVTEKQLAQAIDEDFVAGN